MNVALQLEQMTIEEKISVMELLWDDLCRHADAVLPPIWHGEVLSQREAYLSEGKEQFNDWTIEKEKIRKGAE